MKLSTVTLLTVLLVNASKSFLFPKDYRGTQVLRAFPNTKYQLHCLQALQDEGTSDFWMEPKRVGHYADIMAEKLSVSSVKNALKKCGIKHKIIFHDLHQDIMNHISQNEEALIGSGDGTRNHRMDWTAYHPYEDIESYMSYLATNFSNICSLTNIGLTYEGRGMWMLKVSTGGLNKPAIFIDGGIHAREWISPAVVTYFLYQLVENSTAYQDILNLVDFYILPDINPDGYSYSWTDERMWRKTRSDHNSSLGCLGVDPNRNWDFHFGEIGTSDNKCFETYLGPYPFSEIEMANVRDQLLAYAADIKVYISFHSYGQLWMYGWGYDASYPDDWQDLDNLAADAVAAITAVYDPTSGSSDDWAKGVANVKYSYSVELRDLGEYGFLLPPDQILPSAVETFEAIKVVGHFVKDTYGTVKQAH